MTCEMCGEDHAGKDEPLYLHGRCHPGHGLDVSINTGRDVVTITGHVCMAPVAELMVAGVRGLGGKELTH